MTPFGLRLQLALDQERQRMANEWFFKWHFIGRDGPVDIDGFDGRKIHYGGIQFGGSARLVYWSTLARYLKLKVGDIFDKLEIELKEYPFAQAKLAITETRDTITSFVQAITRDAIEKDRVLRGNGFEKATADPSQSGSLLLAVTDAHHRSEALKAFLEAKETPPEKMSRLYRIEKLLREHKELVGICLFLGGLIGGAAIALFKLFFG
jgi:hypothetical protein